MLIAIILLILAAAAVLTVGVEKLIARLGVRPEEPSKPGLMVLAERLDEWSQARKRK